MTRHIAAIEANFLGCLLRSPDEFWAITDMVAPEMFSVPIHQRIYDGIRFLCEAGRGVTFATLRAHLPSEDDDGTPYVSHLAVLKENAIEAGAARDYASAISERSAGSRIATLGEWMSKEIRGGKRSPEEISSEAAMTLQEIMSVASPVRPLLLGEITHNVIVASNNARQSDTLPGYTTGLLGLDELIGLMMGGDFIAVLAAIGEGKSGLLAQIGKHIAKDGPVLACHNEMSNEQNGSRAIAAAAGLSVRAIREGAFDFSEYESILEAQKRIERLKFHVYHTSKMTVRAIKSRALHMKRTGGLAAITIDGAKRLRCEGKYRDVWERREEITGSLKELAIDLRVPVLVAFQRTRTARRRDDALPQLDDAQFPSLEEDADIIVAAWREESFLMMNKPNAKAGGEAWEEWEHKIKRARGVGKMIGLKVRSGPPFAQREFKWNGPATQFEDM